MATYHLRPSTDGTPGDDSHAGTSYATAWANIQKFLDTAASGDDLQVHVGTYPASTYKGVTLSKAGNCYQKVLTITAAGDGTVTYEDVMDMTGGSGADGIRGSGVTKFTATAVPGGDWRTVITPGDIVILSAPSGANITAGYYVATAVAAGELTLDRSCNSGAGADTCTYTIQTSQIKILGSGWAGTSRYTFDGINFVSSGGAYRDVITQGPNQYGLLELIFQNATLGADDGTSKILRMLDNNADQNIFKFNNCTLNADAVPASTVYNGSILQIGSEDASLTGRGWDRVEFNNCTMNCGGQYGLWAAGAGNRIVINGNTWTMPLVAGLPTRNGRNMALTHIEDAASSNVDTIECRNNTHLAGVTQGIEFSGGFNTGVFIGNNISINSSYSPSGSSSNDSPCIGLTIGADGSVFSNTPKNVICERNTIRQYGSVRSHCLLFGRANAGSTCRENYLDGGNYCLVVKSAGAYIKGNYCYTSGASRSGAIQRDGTYNVWENNTLHSENGDAFQGDRQSGTPDFCAFKYNVFSIGPTSTGSCITETAATTGDGAAKSNFDRYVFDYNVYRYVGSTGQCAYLNSTACAALSNLITAWGAYAARSRLNDANSIAAASVSISGIGGLGTISAASLGAVSTGVPLLSTTPAGNNVPMGNPAPVVP